MLLDRFDDNMISSPPPSPKKNVIIIAIAVGVPLLVIAVAIATVLWLKRRKCKSCLLCVLFTFLSNKIATLYKFITTYDMFDECAQY